MSGDSYNWEEIEEKRKAEIVEQIVSEITVKNPEIFNGKMRLKESLGESSLYDLIKTHVYNHRDVMPDERDEFVKEIAGQATGYGPLAEFWIGDEAQEITEIQVNADPDGRVPVFYGKHGQNHYAGDHYFKGPQEVLDLVRKHVDGTGRTFGTDTPIVDAWLPDGSRLAAVGFKANPYEATVATFRKSPTTRPPMPLEKMVENGTFPQLFYDIMVNCVVPGHVNLGVFGGTDTGKTTVMRSLGLFIDPWDRTIIAEPSFELHMPNLRNCINLLTVKIGGKEIVTMSDQCDTINRNNPTRAIVAEVRGGETVAASDIFTSIAGGAWLSGHAPSLKQLKARWPKMYARGGMTLPLNMVDGELCSMFHYMIFVDKDSRGNRTLMSLIEVLDDDFKEIIVFDKQEFAATGRKRWIWNSPIDYERMGELVFKGANNMMAEKYVEIPGDGMKKYLYPGLGVEPSAT